MMSSTNGRHNLASMYFWLLLFVHVVCTAQSTVSHRHYAADLWNKTARADGDTSFVLRIFFGASDSAVESATESLISMAHPSSPNFGKHWTAEEIVDHFSPPSSSVEAVSAWLKGAGYETSQFQVSKDSTHVMVKTTVGKAEKLLGTRYHHLQHRDASPQDTQVGVSQYSLPDAVSRHVSFVHPTYPLPPGHSPGRKSTSIREGLKTRRQAGMNSAQSGNAPAIDCLQYTTPECLRQPYNIPGDSMPVHPDNSIGVFERAGQTWLPEDLDNFFSNLEPQLVGQRPIVEFVTGGFHQRNFTGFPFNAESDLDFEYAMPLTYPQPVINYQVGDKYNGGQLNHLLAAFDSSYCEALDPIIDGVSGPGAR